MKVILPQTQTIQVLLDKVGRFPQESGVYLMRDASREVIYIGKAKELRSRVKSYFLGGDGRLQLPALMLRVCDIDTIVTENEEQAFILERDLIQKYKPRYNIRLKDDKAFLSVRIDMNAPWPRLELVRKRTEDGATYFGPYSSSYELRTLMEIVKRVVPLRTCTNTVFFNRQRPCLEYQIKRCAGPCCLPVDPEQYKRWLKQALSILQGKSQDLAKELEAHMEKAAHEMRFEDAAAIRDRLDVLKNFGKGHALTTWSGEDRDVFGLYREEGLVALNILRVRFGKISDSVNYTFTDVSIPNEEVLESAVEQFYEGGRDIPEEILVPFEIGNQNIVKDALEKKRDEKLDILVPERGVKARLVALAETNARHHFSTKFDADTRYQEVSSALAKMLGLRQIPRKIECVDISNFQGSDIVGAIVSFFDGAPQKDGYRKYKISRQDKPDDFAAVYEVVERRLRRGLEDGDLPDLLVIDGGPGQLAKALEAREAVKADVEIVSLAKMRTESDVSSTDITRSNERIFIPTKSLPVELTEGAEVTNLMQRIRDEAHRFVITFHRQTRKKRVVKSKLDDIRGLGPERRGRLLRHFGAISAIVSADPNEVAKIGRMPRSLADKVIRELGKK